MSIPSVIDGTVKWTVEHGDCLEVLKSIPDGSIDSVVCDPPYGISFMGRSWDTYGAREFQAWCESWSRECYRVLKPGGHLVAFGGCRTYHRLASGVEDAGFEIRDKLVWLFGSGFPKSLDVSKAIDKAAGAERPRIPGGVGSSNTVSLGKFQPGQAIDAEPLTDAAREWDGWGTALKPAHEPIVLARKPLVGTVAGNVLAYGTGAINIDASRTPIAPDDDIYAKNPHTVGTIGSTGIYGTGTATLYEPGAGRWPANVLLSEEAAAEVDRQSGVLTSGAAPARREADTVRTPSAPFGGQEEVESAREANSGGASRFFPVFKYSAKAPRSERDFGLDDEPTQTFNRVRPGGGGLDDDPRWAPTQVKNNHPTVKPVAVMRWLVKLVTPPGGIVLDPFTGSGTTGIAAMREGFRFIGIEREEEHARTARARIDGDMGPMFRGLL